VRRPTQDHRIVIAGAGYAGLHAALRLATKLKDDPGVELTLIDRHDYHQALTELPRVAAGTRAADAVRIPLDRVLAERVRFVETEVVGFDLRGQALETKDGRVAYTRLVLALGSRPNDFAIPGLAERTISLYSVADAERVWAAVNHAIATAAQAADPSGSAAWPPWWSAAVAPPVWSWPGSWPRCSRRWRAATAWRPTAPGWSWSRRAPASWPAPLRPWSSGRSGSSSGWR
jgi:NADPH-dependent 2,4-dienoyl-CoA reductase/sulfur reductase-like enzyme